MLQALRRHPLPMRTRFGHSLVVTYALPPAILEPLLPPGLTLDTYTSRDGSTHGFVAVGIVSTQGLRPAPLPAALGMDVVLTGYRIFATFPTPAGKTMRGLYILRSDTHRVVLAAAGNLLTRYRYHLARVGLTVDGDRLTATVDSRDGGADLTVTADLGSRPAPLPAGSPFARTCGAGPVLPNSLPGTIHPPQKSISKHVITRSRCVENGVKSGVQSTVQRSVEGDSVDGDTAGARRFAGPLPYTFDHEAATGSIVVVKAHRSAWTPEPVAVRVSRCTFLERGPFAGTRPVLAQAFHVADLDYGWHRGVRRTVDPT
ncbi:DUF2071 domain-containing protein [Dactylosporangium sp. NPDC049525]|uniref:DUF2071 domain-containing protein n=1 Tax=Dactylosporangium sp. NPDC049525 TaxID=3154730 RepID=UPI003426BED9